MKKIFGIQCISATTLRIATAMFNQQTTGRSVKEQSDFSAQMAQSQVKRRTRKRKIEQKPKVVLKAAEKVGNYRIVLRK